MSDQISERMLERARLGELDESELAELVSRLEREEGGTHRLDALIEADAEFLKQHPATQMVPLIREQLRRRAREAARKSQRKGSTMLSIRQMFSEHRAQAGVLVVLLIAATAAGALSLLGERESPKAPVPDTRLTEVGAARVATGEKAQPITLVVGETMTFAARGVSGVAVAVSSVVSVEPSRDDRHLILTANAEGRTSVTLTRDQEQEVLKIVVVAPPDKPDEVEKSPARDEFVEFVDRLDRRLTDSNELILEPGEQITFDARGVQRIAIDRNEVAEARVDEESRAVTLRASDVGLTGVRVFFADHKPAVMYVRVADTYSPEEMFPGSIVARAPAGVIDACHDAARKRGNGAGEIAIRVLTSRSGDVSSAHAEVSSLDEEFEDCLIASAYQHEFPEVEVGAYRTALLEFDFDNKPRDP